MVSANICQHYSHIWGGLGVRGLRKLGLSERNASTISYSHVTCGGEDALGKSHRTVHWIQAPLFAWGECFPSHTDHFATQAHCLQYWRLTWLLTQKQHGKCSVASGSVCVGGTPTRWTTRGWREGQGCVATVLQGVNASCSFQQRDTIRICDNGQVPWETYALCLGSGPLKQMSLTWQYGVSWRSNMFFRECSKKTLSWEPVWNMDWGRGGVRNPGQTTLARSAIGWSLTTSKRMDVLSMRTGLLGRDSELWTFAPGGQANTSLQELVLWVDQRHAPCSEVPPFPYLRSPKN